VRSPSQTTLSCQALATLGATTIQNVTATFSRHARAKAVSAFAFQYAGLKCSFHIYIPIEYRWERLAAGSVDVFPGQKKGGLFY
jgi:hypothetical protein